MSRDENKEERIVLDMGANSGFDMRPYSIALELKRLMSGMIDAGTSIDSGTSDTQADLHPKINGIEYHITVKIAKELAS